MGIILLVGRRYVNPPRNALPGVKGQVVARKRGATARFMGSMGVVPSSANAGENGVAAAMTFLVAASASKRLFFGTRRTGAIGRTQVGSDVRRWH